MKIESEKFKERLRNIFCEDVNNLVRRRRLVGRIVFSWPSKTAEGSSSRGDAVLVSMREREKLIGRRRIEREGQWKGLDQPVKRTKKKNERMESPHENSSKSNLGRYRNLS